MNNYFGFLANAIDAVFICLGKTGKILNARGNRICFILEGICLCYWFVMDLNRGLYAQAIGVFFSMAIAIYGYRKWGKREKSKADSQGEEK